MDQMFEDFITPAKILIIDDEKDILNSLKEILKTEGFLVDTAQNKKEALEKLKQEIYDCALLDVWLDNEEQAGLEILKTINEETPFMPCIMMSGHASIEKAIYAMKIGAYDFLEKPFSMARLTTSLKRAVETRILREENSFFKEKQYNSPLISKSSSMKKALKEMRQLKIANSITLIGEEGCGKKHFAFSFAKSWKKKFYYIDCSKENVNEILLMLKKLIQDNIQKIFILDYLEELNKKNQDTLIELVKMTLGNSNNQWISLIRQLPDLFRTDLLERLMLFKIELPNAEQRHEDLKEIINLFIYQISKITKRARIEINLDEIKARNWTGNMKQIKLYLEQKMYQDRKNDDETDIIIDHAFLNMNLKDAKTIFENIYLKKQLANQDGSISRTAKKAGIDRTTLYRKLHSEVQDESDIHMAEEIEDLE